MTDTSTIIKPETSAKRERIETAVSGVVSKLTPTQRTFVIEYLLHGNAKRAAEVAGYSSPEKQGPRLRHHERIQAAIDEYFHQQEMGAREVIARLSQQAKADYGRYLEFDPMSREVICDLEQLLADGLGHLIKKFGYDRTGTDSYVQTVEFYDAHTALVDVARYHGLFKDRTDVTSQGEKLESVVIYLPANGRNGDDDH